MLATDNAATTNSHTFGIGVHALTVAIMECVSIAKLCTLSSDM